MNARRLKFDIRQAGRHILLVLLVWLALNTAFYLFATRPRIKEYASLMEGSAPQLAALERRKRQVEHREAFLEALRQAESDLRHLREDVLSTREERMVEVQREVERLCAQFNIDFESVTYDSEALPGQELDKLIMVVPLQGNYANLRRFLQAVEGSEKFLLVERVALAEGKEGGVLLQLNITLTTYFNTPPVDERATRRRDGAQADA